MDEEYFYLDKRIVWLLRHSFGRQSRESPQAMTGTEHQIPMV